jgi:hypothetical protein
LVRREWPSGSRRGGFFVRDPYRPLGEVRVGGVPIEHEPVSEPWGPRRACVHADGEVRLVQRGGLAADPPGDLVMAGPSWWMAAAR